MKRHALENWQDRYQPSKTTSTFHKVQKSTMDEESIRSIVRQEIMATLFQIKNQIEQKMRQVDSELKIIREELEKGGDVAERILRVERELALLKDRMENRTQIKKNQPTEVIRRWHSEKVHIPSNNLSSVLFPDEQISTSSRSVPQNGPVYQIHPVTSQQLNVQPISQPLMQQIPQQIQYTMKKSIQPPSPTKSDDVEAAKNQHQTIENPVDVINELNRNKKQFLRSKSNKGLTQQTGPLSPLGLEVQQTTNISPITFTPCQYQPAILQYSQPILSVHHVTSNIASSSLIIHEQELEQSILESPHKY